MSAFEELGICPEIIQAIEEDEWLLPSAVQQEAIPLILTGGDVLAAAETGSGKTGAFGLPCLQIVHETLCGKCKTSDGSGSNMKCELDVNDKDVSVKLTEDALECKSEEGKRWNGVRGTFEVTAGKYMYEVEVISGLLRVGWSASNCKLELGMESRSFGYGSTGKKSWNKAFEDYGEAYQDGDVVGVLLDHDVHTISFFKNGKDLGVAYTLPSDLEDVGLKPHICGKGFAALAKFDGPMEYPVEGYAPLGEIDPSHRGAGAAVPQGARVPLCMILEPTRDLADQTYKCMTKFNKHLENPKVRIALVVGGQDDKDQIRELQEGTDIVVGTLPKTLEHIRKGRLDVSQVKFLVLDEADDLQKKDDKKEIPALNQQIKRGRRDRVQTLFFSATLHTPEVKDIISEITVNPIWVDLKGKDAVPEHLHHAVYFIDPSHDLPWSDAQLTEHAKFPEVRPPSDGVHAAPSESAHDQKHPTALKMSEKIKQMKPKMLVKIADSFKMSQCMVFCRTNKEVDIMEEYLCRLGGTKKGFGAKMESGKENPYSCVVLAGGRSGKERTRNLETFKEGDVRFMICTDVAARGIDVAGLPFVIQMTLPDDIENYIHRIGRCGRAERLGLAISLVATQREKAFFAQAERRPLLQSSGPRRPLLPGVHLCCGGMGKAHITLALALLSSGSGADRPSSAACQPGAEKHWALVGYSGVCAEACLASRVQRDAFRILARDDIELAGNESAPCAHRGYSKFDRTDSFGEGQQRLSLDGYAQESGPSPRSECALRCAMEAIGVYWACAAVCIEKQAPDACITSGCLVSTAAFEVPCLKACNTTAERHPEPAPILV